MKKSTDRILTTHVGSLPRPDDLIEANRAGTPEAIASRLKVAVASVVEKQAEVGLDVVNDGEYGKPMTETVDFGAWATYVWGRLSGFEFREIEDRSLAVKRLMGRSKDRFEFQHFYASGADGTGSNRPRPFRIPVNIGPIEYTGHALVERDIANLKAALTHVDVEDAFLSAVFTGIQFGESEYYKTKEEWAVALAEAMREEYRAIVDSGLNVQIDDPLLVNVYEFDYSMDGDIAAFRKWAEGHIELLNHALEGLPEERVRYHLCWGSWAGPHSSDLPIGEIIDLLVGINASQYSFEAANPQHEHEWRAWKDVKLPGGRALIPGVVTHKTNVLERPEVVADRIVRFADVVGRENVLAGTDCGMGGRIDPDLAWAKLGALGEGARLATERLW
jgi:5-methyltetrahydropteroyltriglutamate--homocysteine methyltransferase